jgi:RNase P/RNase MRP subunit p30
LRRYVDLHLKPQTPEYAQEMTHLAAELGYCHVASTSPIGGVSTRIDIVAKHGKELHESLRRSKAFDIVAVRCLSKEVARMVARDDRVDILLFPDDPIQRKLNWLDRHEAELLDGTGRAYEINASEFLAKGSARLSKVITTIKRDLASASHHDIPIVLSSGATCPILMREPRALMALATLLDIDQDYAADMLSSNPEAILKKHRAKSEEDA